MREEHGGRDEHERRRQEDRLPEHREHHHDAAKAAAGAAAGGLGGAMAGAAVGTITLGPIGSIIGIIAGAIGGGWVGLAAGEAEARYTDTHDAEYRAHYEGSPDRLADRSFEQMRPAYQLGHIAAHNPDYVRRPFAEVERELQAGWNEEMRIRHGDWQTARHFARHAYEHATAEGVGGATFGTIDQSEITAIGETEGHQRPSYSDPIPPGDPDHVAGEGPVPGREGR